MGPATELRGYPDQEECVASGLYKPCLEKKTQNRNIKGGSVHGKLFDSGNPPLYMPISTYRPIHLWYANTARSMTGAKIKREKALSILGKISLCLRTPINFRECYSLLLLSWDA